MKKDERQKIKDFIFNVLQIFQHQEDFLADESGLANYENPMFDKAMSFILKKNISENKKGGVR